MRILQKTTITMSSDLPRAIGKLLTIDPGNCTGWAYFEDGILRDSGMILYYGLENMPWYFPHAHDVGTLVIEKPRIYDRRNWKGDPNDLIRVGIIAGHINGCISNGHTTKWVYPQEWKGNRPKEVDHRHTKSLLGPVELEILQESCKNMVKSQLHNMLDAIGIGLWYLRRK
jgi:hypothetical protein